MTCGVGFRKSMIVVLAFMCRLCIVCAFWDMKHQSTEFRSRHRHVCMYVCVCLFLDCEYTICKYNRCSVHVKYYTLAMADNYTTIQQQKPQTITTKPNTRPSKQQQQSNNQAFSHCWRNDKPKPNRCFIILLYTLRDPSYGIHLHYAACTNCSMQIAHIQCIMAMSLYECTHIAFIYLSTVITAIHSDAITMLMTRKS